MLATAAPRRSLDGMGTTMNADVAFAAILTADLATRTWGSGLKAHAPPCAGCSPALWPRRRGSAYRRPRGRPRLCCDSD